MYAEAQSKSESNSADNAELIEKIKKDSLYYKCATRCLFGLVVFLTFFYATVLIVQFNNKSTNQESVVKVEDNEMIEFPALYFTQKKGRFDLWDIQNINICVKYNCT